ncbi:MAG: ribosome biogenesis GTP-binding protein YihA/YsxC [Melioribacteraceae bacterium]|nr:ribosome biogenesis GTP-binding protein YihA/YsxC [Melioribacteraceae bacterium]
MKKIEFLKPVFTKNDFPKENLHQLILCGRSNVGKSSFINSIFNTKIAKTSSTPGKTRSLNFYKVENKFFIVDLPGFGFAKVSRKERDEWNKLILALLSNYNSIKVAFHIIDSRHSPQESDIELNQFIRQKEIPYFVILNKVDKLNQKEKSESIKRTIEFFPELIVNENLFLFSALNGFGKKEIFNLISKLFL